MADLIKAAGVTRGMNAPNRTDARQPPTAGSRSRSTPARPTDASRADHDPTLTEVGAGTPMGELLRRYWHPVGLTGDASDTPRQVRVLGEDLILFRDKAGRAGLVHPHCAHRGASLYYGKVEERGIRCCYHGWLFDVHGHCLEQPCEPDLGARRRVTVRQPWYPVEERYGLVFAYLGPPDKKPVLPRYDAPRTARRRRIRRSRREQHRRRRPADHSLQLAAALREPGRPVPRRDPALELQRHPVRRADGPDAEGHLGPRRRRRQGHLAAPARRTARRCDASAKPCCRPCA